jgi:hypothetical protein
MNSNSTLADAPSFHNDTIEHDMAVYDTLPKRIREKIAYAPIRLASVPFQHAIDVFGGAALESDLEKHFRAAFPTFTQIKGDGFR